MEFVLYILEHSVCYGVASIPLILVFLQLKIFKLPPKSIVTCLFLNLLVSIFFWLKLKDAHIALYQGMAYFSSFAWILAEWVLIKIGDKNKSRNDLTVSDD